MQWKEKTKFLGTFYVKRGKWHGIPYVISANSTRGEHSKLVHHHSGSVAVDHPHPRRGVRHLTQAVQPGCRCEDCLLSVAGECQWGQGRPSGSGRRDHSSPWIPSSQARPAPPAEQPEIIAAYLQAGLRRSGPVANADQPSFYFGLDPHGVRDDIRASVDHHPAFRVRYVLVVPTSHRT